MSVSRSVIVNVLIKSYLKLNLLPRRIKLKNYHQHFTNYQLPLRLSDELANQLHEVATATGIQKSKLCRMGISRIISDIKLNGLAESMGKLNREYSEIV